ncbi:MAG: endolytic transglycosylase MltG [Flavobacteriaceae bacterium]|nr:endolytic transglycosylase MltG [Flavobacteriaceae bacterium]
MNLKKIILSIIAITLIIGGLIGYKFYVKIYAPNVTEEAAVYIPTNADFSEVKEAIQPYLGNINSFEWVAQKKNYPNVIKSGRYIIKEGMNNNDLIDLLRSGKQTPVMLTFNNQDTLEKLSGRIATQLEADSLTILNTILDPAFLSENNLSKQSALQIFIPNTYELYWNTSAEKFRDRMLKEYKTFWNEQRIAKAKALNLTKSEVMTLASIVQKETALSSERPVVAGLYLNRLRDKWPLQADPTIIFALKQKYGQDYEVKRVLNNDLLIDSPYNTYKNIGLPPALIAMPDILTIDAVLNPSKHDYYYMCASVSDLGKHEFARTLAQHNVNADKYRKWVAKQGINR